MKDNWKLWLAVIACTIVMAFCARRAYNAFHERPPSWVKTEDRVGPAIGRDGRLNGAWKEFSDLLGTVRRESAQQQLPVGGVSLLALETDATNAVSIATEPVVNQGFNPLNNIQASIGGDERRFVGFYATDGGPIPFTIVRVPGRGRNPPVTLHLKSPIAPGETQLVVRVERRRAPVNIGKDGKAQAGLGRFPRTPNAVYARAIALPPGGVIVRSVPDTTATVSGDVAPLVSWIGTATNANAPMSVVFTLPK
ncbi:MAG TPA: hypothetical protein VNL17_00540 [Verrucomicrobiae bacterium]|nr:hypothetical protein [Verrucomicrobiae bacterium]